MPLPHNLFAWEQKFPFTEGQQTDRKPHRNLCFFGEASISSQEHLVSVILSIQIILKRMVFFFCVCHSNTVLVTFILLYPPVVSSAFHFYEQSINSIANQCIYNKNHSLLHSPIQSSILKIFPVTPLLPTLSEKSLYSALQVVVPLLLVSKQRVALLAGVCVSVYIYKYPIQKS